MARRFEMLRHRKLRNVVAHAYTSQMFAKTTPEVSFSFTNDFGAKRVACEIKTQPMNDCETLFGWVQHVMTVNSCIVDMS